MKSLLRFFNWLYLLALSLWVGGMFFIGILAEIVVRVKLKEQPITASKVMFSLGTGFNIYSVKYICYVIIVAEILRFIVIRSGDRVYLPNQVTRWKYTREACLATMMIMAFYMGSILRPEMSTIDKQKKTVQLQTLQRSQVDSIIKTAASSLAKAKAEKDVDKAASMIMQINPAGQMEVLAEKSSGDQKLKILFDAYHQRFEWLYAINMILGLTCLFIHAKELTRFRED
tara:strand:+ start:95 stop:781 length:687 start_codon:yes stop_codon:yes gene_type:complete